MSSANKNLLLFWFWCLLFIFYFLIALARTSSFKQNRSGRNWHSYLFLVLEEKFQPSTFKYDISCGSVIYGFYYMEVHSFYIQFWKLLSFWHFVKCLFCVYWDNFITLIFNLLLRSFNGPEPGGPESMIRK